MTVIQKFIFQDTQIFSTRDTIQRTRKMCRHWTRKTQHMCCELDKNKRCRPSVCLQFVSKKGL